MIKSTILLTCFVAILAFIAKFLVDTGIFRHIETKGLDKCRLIVPIDGEHQAFEDFAIDYENGIGYMPGDNRTWLHTFHIPETTKKQGNMYTFDIESETFQNLDLIDYPYEHFHPLGIGLLKSKNDHLFMTNHRIENGEIIGTVEIFQIDSSNKNQLKWIDSVVHPLFTVPDDVLAIDEKTFYVTNVYHYRPDKSILMHKFEVMTKRPWTNLLLCSKQNQWQCSIIIDSISLANGVAASLDLKTIYVAASTEKRVRVYERHPEDNSLTYMHSLYVPFSVDNLLVNDHDQLIAAGHPKVFEFLAHEENPREKRAPSEVVIFTQPKSNLTYETLLVTNGELLSASTIAGTYKQKVLVSGLLDHGLLVCKDLI